MNIDYFQRLLYQFDRYIIVLTIEAGRRPGEMIYPSIFKSDLESERDSLRTVLTRLTSLRERTTAILDMVITIRTDMYNNLSI